MNTFPRGWLLAMLLGFALSHASVFGGAGAPSPPTPLPPGGEGRLTQVPTPVAKGGGTQAGEAKQDPVDETPAERIRKALDQSLTLDFTGASLQEAIEHLKTKTRINFTLDNFAVQQMGFAVDPINGGVGVMQFHLKNERGGKVRSALQRLLNSCNLSYVILEDTVLISTESIGLHRQMQQRVNISYEQVPLQKALKDLARRTGVNLVVDPRLTAEAQNKVTLQVDDASLETGVRLLAELGGLRAVRVGNVLFVTSEARAEKLHRQEPVQPGIPGLLGPGIGL
ncbi:MAG: hypothetical protein L0Y72_31720 [Gemmataceae bacterium]|nr:hypothetical protein [Gemmataceae bacterium]MCI0743622.1 hypothetical protein [Gemmataceae bacterium]